MYFNKIISFNIISRIVICIFLICGMFMAGASEKYDANAPQQVQPYSVSSSAFENLHPNNEMESSINPFSASDTERNAAIIDRANKEQETEAVNKMISTGARLAASGRASDVAHSMVGDAVNQEIKQWLNRFGTAQVNLNFDKNFSLKESSLDWLAPWYDSASFLFFSQLGIRNKDSRNTLNLGVGIRTLENGWLYGLNTFYDNDLTGHNHRIGLGAEVWTDYLQLAANGYFRLNGWHSSRDFSDYKERPATGGDLRANAYLPALPQLGGKLMYEQYTGERVALFGKDNLQRNPYAVTAGINYTPVPLLTVGVDQRMGKSSKHETQWNLQMNYRLGESFQSQLSPSAVAGTRLLAESRYNLVDRNNNIVLEYQKQQVVKLTLSPATISGLPGQVYQVNAQVQGASAVREIVWSDAELIAAGGTLTPLSTTQFNLVLPPYKRTAQVSRVTDDLTANFYSLSALAVDHQGNRSNSFTLSVTVQQPQLTLTAAVIGDGAPANGKTAITVEFTVADFEGKPLAGQEVVITTNNGALPNKITEKTDANGVARIALTNTTDGVTVVTAEVEGQRQSVDTHFVKGTIAADKSTLAAVPTSIIADGLMASTITLELKDTYGDPQAGANVAFDTTLGNMGVITDHNDGTYSAPLTSTTLGVATVTVKVDGAAFSVPSVTVNFTADPIPDAGRSSFTVSTPDILADGTMSSTLSFVPVDKNGHFISGMQGLSFTQNGVPVSISPITEQPDSYTATVVGNSVGDVTITPQVDTLILSTLQKKISLFPVPTLTGILVNGQNFATDKGFPKTIFKNATFQLQMDNDVANNTQYEWSSSFTPNVSVNDQGQVTITYQTYSEVAVTAKSKKFPSYSVSYRFYPNRWIYDGGRSLVSSLEASRQCQGSDMSAVLESSRATNGTRAPDGTLWGEWGSLTAYSSDWQSGEYWVKKTSTDFETMNMDTGALQPGPAYLAFPLCALSI
ncbi:MULTISPECIES: inverse autotransporter invasin Inv [Yersinia pseudotuberculosis complex]|nr:MULTISPECIES: inverse autotransporter invasin Inv [Yersinia pseudotuberculosis complex]MCE4113675.1 autotransporter invasin Inv [Yersinia pseudotuberculosis]MCF1162735.1 autotransporter invasin Inv [Yersinia pseudotuberculosis]WLF02294.1 inverse autotransporter invasin Inv [Yersinia pseudotuberculosis]